MSQRYRLEVHPTNRPRPMAIWDCFDPSSSRLVAILKGDASATYEEAKTMVDALNKTKESKE